MIAKEWRDARWKFAVGALLFLALVATNLLPYQDFIGNIVGEHPPEPADMQRTNPREISLFVTDMLYGTYEVGRLLLALLAAALGVGLISDEVGRSTVFLLLSRPVSRTRLLLVKYAVGAGALLGVTLLGSIGLIVSAAARGYPLDHLSPSGIVLSTLLMWLGTLSVLSVGLLCSVFFRNVLISATVTLMIVYAMFLGPQMFVRIFLWEEYNSLNPPWQLIWWLTPTSHWSSMNLYAGEGVMATSFLICLAAAATPLLTALWFFQRKAY